MVSEMYARGEVAGGGGRRTRRGVLGTLGVAGGASAATAVLAACGQTESGASGGDAPQLSKSPVTVTAFVGITDIQVNRFPDEVGTPFKAKNPNITLVATPQ